MRKVISRATAALAASVLVVSLAGAAAARESAPQTLTVSIVGPDTIPPLTPCTWIANVQGGTPPYTYTWYVGGSGYSTNHDITHGTNDPSIVSMSAHLLVWDSNGGYKQVGKTIFVRSTAGLCPM